MYVIWITSSDPHLKPSTSSSPVFKRPFREVNSLNIAQHTQHQTSDLWSVRPSDQSEERGEAWLDISERMMRLGRYTDTDTVDTRPPDHGHWSTVSLLGLDIMSKYPTQSTARFSSHCPALTAWTLDWEKLNQRQDRTMWEEMPGPGGFSYHDQKILIKIFQKCLQVNCVCPPPPTSPVYVLSDWNCRSSFRVSK